MISAVSNFGRAFCSDRNRISDLKLSAATTGSFLLVANSDKYWEKENWSYRNYKISSLQAIGMMLMRFALACHKSHPLSQKNAYSLWSLRSSCSSYEAHLQINLAGVKFCLDYQISFVTMCPLWPMAWQKVHMILIINLPVIWKDDIDVALGN